MDTLKNKAWQSFEKSGKISEYLKFKMYERNEMKFEAGEEIGVNKDGRLGDENHEIW